MPKLKPFHIVRLAVPVIVSLSFLEAAELPKEIVSRLNADAFRERENAQNELLVWGRAKPHERATHILQAADHHADPEIRERCMAVLRDIAIDEYLRDGEGFLGIRMGDEMAEIQRGKGLLAVMRVVEVLRDSAAEKAGMQVNDLIYKLDGKKWVDGAASPDFMEAVRRLKPGDEVELGLMRDGKLRELRVELGRRPAGADIQRGFSPVDPEEVEKKARDAYFEHWLEKQRKKKR